MDIVFSIQRPWDYYSFNVLGIYSVNSLCGLPGGEIPHILKGIGEQIALCRYKQD